MNKKKERRRFIILCLAPAVILFGVFMILPTLNVFWMSTLKWGGLSADKTFVGFNNFVLLMQDMNFIRALQNTILIIAVLGESAAAGLIGGGGIGDLGIRYGHQRYMPEVMYAVLILLTAIVIVIQTTGNKVSKALNKR